MAKSFKEKLWQKPKAWFWFGLPLGAFVFFVVGVVAVIGFNFSLKVTSTEEFCVSCHGMDIAYEEYKTTHHHSSVSGVGATCVDCHLPQEFIPKMARKIEAAREVWHDILGTIDTPEKYEEHRAAMAEREWARMKANDSQECRNCHDDKTWNLAKQSKKAKKKHDPEYLAKKPQTCIDCHKGIAHEMPQEDDSEFDDIDWDALEEDDEEETTSSDQ